MDMNFSGSLMLELIVGHLLYREKCVSCLVVSDSLPLRGLWPPRILYPWGFSRQECLTGLACPSPGDLLTQGLNPCLLVFCIGRQVLYH